MQLNPARSFSSTSRLEVVDVSNSFVLRSIGIVSMAHVLLAMVLPGGDGYRERFSVGLRGSQGVVGGREGFLDRGVDLEQLGQPGGLEGALNWWREAGEFHATLPAA